MSSNLQELQSKKCKPCEGGVEPLNKEQAQEMLQELPEWELSSDDKWIRRKWKAKDFMGAMDFLNRIAELAEQENHHPDLHLTGYRGVEVALSTHAIGGLSENDFIVAAKIQELSIEKKK